MQNNIDIAKRYLATLEKLEDCGSLTEFLSTDFVHEEFPNRLVSTGAKRDLAAVLDGCEKRKIFLSEQRFEIRNAVASGSSVILEVSWTGKTAVAAGTLPAGSEMKAYFALFFEFRKGKIVSQRSYGCFEK